MFSCKETGLTRVFYVAGNLKWKECKWLLKVTVSYIDNENTDYFRALETTSENRFLFCIFFIVHYF